MAASLKGGAIVSTIRKRFMNQIFSPAPTVVICASRNVHASTYDKDIEEYGRLNVVPDVVIDANSDKYWAPNPKTGVFGPVNPAAGARSSGQYQNRDGTGSVLDQKLSIRS